MFNKVPTSSHAVRNNRKVLIDLSNIVKWIGETYWYF